MKQTFLTGLAVVVPIGVTLYILFFFMEMMDRLLLIIPKPYQPDNLLGFHVPGLGIIVTVLFVFTCGLATKSYVGKRLVRVWEDAVRRIPVMRSVYNASKQVADKMFMDMSHGFQKVVIIEFPRKGTLTIGFMTGKSDRIAEGYVNVFVPTTPNPTSGYLIMVPEQELIATDMSVEEAFTLILSGGIVAPLPPSAPKRNIPHQKHHREE